MAWQPVEGSTTLEYDDSPADPGAQGKNKAAWQAQSNGFKGNGSNKKYFRVRFKSN